MRCFLLCLFVLLGAFSRADAFSRPYQPMGDYLRDSPLVIVADINIKTVAPFETVLTVREVLKTTDNAVVAGDQIKLPLGMTRWVVTSDADNALVVMAPDWKNEGSHQGLMVSEVYLAPAQIEAARALLAIYDLPDERTQLVALQKRVGQGKAEFDKQMLADLRRMRNRENFEIALATYPLLETEGQTQMLRWFGDVGDNRALPLLIGALDSADKKVRGWSANTLEFRFPDAPGVTPAFERIFGDDERRALAAHYLRMRNSALLAATPDEPTPWQRAQTSLDGGDTSGARATYFALAESDGELWTTLNAAEKLIPLLQTSADKSRLRALVGARLERESPDYVQARGAVKILRALPDAQNVAPLLNLLAPPVATSTSLWDETASAATFALLELGADSRKRGAARVVENARERLSKGQNFEAREAIFYACELAWLADEATWRDLPAQLSPNAAPNFAALQPLRRAAQTPNSPDEARALVALLPGFFDSNGGNARSWIFARLGDLRESIAVAPLFAQFKQYSVDNDDIQRALLQIGGPAVETGALELLQQSQPELRATALDILHNIRGVAVRPLLLQILRDGDEFDRIKAVTLLGYVGQTADLALLTPLADFWQTEGALQNRATSAVAEIRYLDLTERMKSRANDLN